jgi:hypothetical protein
LIKDRFSRIVFLIAGIYGLIVLLPGFFGEKMLAEKMPPPITHPEFYYGFFGVVDAGTNPTHCRHGRRRRFHPGRAFYRVLFQAQSGAAELITGEQFLADSH